MVRICCGSRDSAVDFPPSNLLSKVEWLTLFDFATARIDLGSPLDSSSRAFSILLSASALFWLLRAGMVVYSYVQWKAVFVGGSNRDLVQIAPGYSIMCGQCGVSEDHVKCHSQSARRIGLDL